MGQLIVGGFEFGGGDIIEGKERKKERKKENIYSTINMFNWRLRNCNVH